MNHLYRLALWNTNGLLQHRLELSTFLHKNKMDMMLILETHFTCKSYLKIHGYNILYDTKHPDGTAHGGTAIIMRTTIEHHQLTMFHKDYIQATSIAIVGRKYAPIILSATYYPQKHSISKEKFIEYFETLGLTSPTNPNRPKQTQKKFS